MEKSDEVNPFEVPFDLKLTQVEGRGEHKHPQSIASIFVEFKTVQSFSEKERVLEWNLPLVALQRKIGENGRFVLPEKGVIDDVFNFTLNDYRVAVNAGFPSLLTIFWSKQGPSSKGESEKPDGSGSDGNDKKILGVGPMKEKDWDYVFQANKILHCSLVNPRTSRMERASHAAFRLKTSNEDDSEADLPQDDERAKIPVWTLASEPSRVYIRETNNELETSATMSGHSKESFNIGAGASYKKLSAEGKYERTTENYYKDESTYGRKQSTMLTIYEIPIVELSLHKSNCRVSDACRQHLVKLRDRRSFDDLMEFFNKYGTVYANKVVLGGRLINTNLFYQETMNETKFRQSSTKSDASSTIGIDPFSIKGGYSDEHGTKTKAQESDKTDKKLIDWTGYGGNPALVSDPPKWLPTVPEYRNWKVVENAEIESIQDFIGSLPGYEDIPGLFQDILASGLYNPEIVHLGPRPQLPGQEKPRSDGLDTAEVGASLNTLAVLPEKPMEYPFESGLGRNMSSIILAKGGVSWQVLDSKEAVRLEISSVMQSLMNTGANRSAVPEHLYHLSLRPSTISIVLQWSSDLVEKGFNLAFPGASQMGKTYRTLNQLAPDPCADVMQKADALSIADFENAKKAFEDSLTNLDKATIHPSLAAFRLDAWSSYLKGRLNNDEAKKDQDFLDSIRKEAKSMPDHDMGQDSSLMSPFTILENNKTLLQGQDVAKCIAAMGHGFIESYTEKASMTAMWRLALPDVSDETFYAFRMMIQKYFFQPRRISEVCDFFSSDTIFKPAPKVTVSIFGYRDRFSVPGDILDKPPSVASSYLMPQVLSRNIERQAVKVRGWKGLHIKGLEPPDSSLTKDMTLAAPEEFFVLNVQRAERLLLLLFLYSKDPKSGVDKDKLVKFGKILDKILGPETLDRNGMMSNQARNLLAGLMRDLEKALPKGDPEKDLK